MEFKLKSLISLILFFGFINAAICEKNLTCENFLNQIDQNQGFGKECSQYTNTIESFINDYKQMFNSVPISCQLHVQTAIKNVKLTIDEMVNEKIDDYLKYVEKMHLNLLEIKNSNILPNSIKQNKTNLHFNAINALRKGDFNIANELIKDSSTSELKEFISEAYDKNILNAGKVIEFLNTLSSEEKIIYGYRVLFDEMKLNQQEFSAPTTTIAYRVFVDFNQSQSNNENILYLFKNLPELLRNFLWNQTVNIANAEMPTEWVYVGTSTIIDTARHITVTTIDRPDEDYAHTASFLTPLVNGSYFYIQSKYDNKQLYAETNEYIIGNQRRRTFTRTITNEIKDQGQWQLEPVQGSSTHFNIKNLYYNEYLAIENGFKSPQFSSNNQLFTTPINLCQKKYCQWSFIRSTYKN